MQRARNSPTSSSVNVWSSEQKRSRKARLRVPSAMPGPRYTSKSATDSSRSPAAAPSTSATTSAGTSSSTTSARSMSEEGKRLTAAATMALLGHDLFVEEKSQVHLEPADPAGRGAAPGRVRQPEADRDIGIDLPHRADRRPALAASEPPGPPSGPSGSGADPGSDAAFAGRDQAHARQPERVGQDVPGRGGTPRVVVLVGEDRAQQLALAREQRGVRAPGAAPFDDPRHALLGMREHDADFEQPDRPLAPPGVVGQRAEQSGHERAPEDTALRR